MIKINRKQENNKSAMRAATWSSLVGPRWMRPAYLVVSDLPLPCWKRASAPKQTKPWHRHSDDIMAEEREAMFQGRHLESQIQSTAILWTQIHISLSTATRVNAPLQELCACACSPIHKSFSVMIFRLYLKKFSSYKYLEASVLW